MADIKALMRSIRKTTKSDSFDNSKYGEIQGWISTGDYGLNRIISGSIYKGVPEGKVILMAGESASGKSFLAAQVAANALNEQDYDVIFYFDSEGGAMQEFFINRGCDTSKIEQVLVESVEDSVVKILSTYKQIEEFKEKDPTFKALFILDSLGALVANKFINDAASGKVVSDMGGRAKICNNLVKACTIPALKTDTSLIIVNHTYDDPSSMFTSKIKAQGGGKGLQFMARINLQCSKVLEKEDKGKKPENYYKATILKFFTAKNSIVKPFYQSVMYLDFSKGPHKYFGLVEPAKEYGFITSPTQGFYVIPSYSEKKFRMKALLDCPEAWESFLPEFDKRSQEDLAYSGEIEDEMSDEFLEEAALDDTSSDEEEADIEVT
jgi:RecA/RadA recombinase